MHIAQPVEFALVPEFGNPADLVDHIHNLVAQGLLLLFGGYCLAGFVVKFAHANKPLIHQPEDQFGFAAPAGGVAMGVGFHAVEPAFFFQVFEDGVGHIGNVLSAQPAEAFDEVPLVVERGDKREAVFLAEFKVFGAAAGGNVDDAGAFFFADFIPDDDLMCLGCGLFNAFHQFFQVGDAAGGVCGGKVIEGAVVSPAFHFSAFEFAQNFVFTLEHVQRAFGEIENLLPLAHFGIGEFGADGGSHVG